MADFRLHESHRASASVPPLDGTVTRSGAHLTSREDSAPARLLVRRCGTELALSPAASSLNAPPRSQGVSMRTAARLLALLGVLVAIAPAARAQYPQRREGFWIGFGLGYGSANIDCDNCASGARTGGVTAFLKLGGTPSRNVLIGGAINGWSHASGGAPQRSGERPVGERGRTPGGAVSLKKKKK